MADSPKISVDDYLVQMRAEVDALLRDVASAVNQAPDGAIIAASERQVFERLAEFRRKAYETAMQMKIDAAQAAFPPSGQPDNRKKSPAQRKRRLQRPDQ